MQKIIILLISLLPLFLKAEVLTLNLPATGSLEPLETRKVMMVYKKPSRSTAPTLLLLPGVQRGFIASDAFLKQLNKEDFGYIALHFSTQPHSIAKLSQDVVPYFQSNQFNLNDYVFEAHYVANWAKEEFGSSIIPVSLSFSGSSSPYLKGFPLVIDIAPITSVRDAKPSLALYHDTLIASNLFNPFGDVVIRSSLDQAYTLSWNPVVKEMIETHNFKQERHKDFLEGYLTSSRALEGFKWDLSSIDSKRVMLMAESETSSLLKGQKKLVREFIESNKSITCIFVRNSKHAIPMDKPSEVAFLLNFVLKSNNNFESGCYDFQSVNNIVFHSENDFIEALNF